MYETVFNVWDNFQFRKVVYEYKCNMNLQEYKSIEKYLTVL
jgi:hypothetical protein